MATSGALVHTATDNQTGGRYEVTRQPDDDYKGLLRVYSKESKLLLEQEVTLSFGAKFGADVSDIADWNMIAMEAMDKETV